MVVSECLAWSSYTGLWPHFEYDRHGSQRPGSQSPVKSALKWTPWPEFCEILHSDWRNRYLLDKAGLNGITGCCSTRQGLSFALCCCDLPRMPRICPGCPGYTLDLSRIRGIQGISGASGANHISNRLVKRKFSSYLFYSFALQLSPSSVKDSKSIFCIWCEKSVVARGLRPHISGP